MKTQYPTITPGEKVLLARPSCGKNVGSPVFDGKDKRIRYVTEGKFVFSREPLPARRSKYEPLECDAKKGVRQ